MRLIKFLNESTPIPLDSWEQVVEKCPKTTSINLKLYRGFDSPYSYGYCPIDKNRKPKDSSIIWHNLMNEGFKHVFGIPFRSESIFATGSRHQAKGYGKVHLIYPSDDFKICWSGFIKDFYDLGESAYAIKLSNNSIKATVLIWAIVSKNKFLYHNFMSDTEEFEIDDFIANEFPDEWHMLDELNILPDFDWYKRILKKFPNCITDFIKTYYKTSNNIQDLLEACNTLHEIMITGSYYCWAPEK